MSHLNRSRLKIVNAFEKILIVKKESLRFLLFLFDFFQFFRKSKWLQISLYSLMRYLEPPTPYILTCKTSKFSSIGSQAKNTISSKTHRFRKLTRLFLRKTMLYLMSDNFEANCLTYRYIRKLWLRIRSQASYE